MKFFTRVLSYLVVGLLGACITLYFVSRTGIPITKLDQLEALITNRFIGEYDTTLMEDSAAAAMVASLGDRWSYYAPASAYASLLEQQENSYVGIGITISGAPEGGGFLILSVEKNGPAKAAGLLPEDIIIAADGQSTAEMDLNTLRNIIRGKEGTPVSITVLRGEETLDFEVVRATILAEVVTWQMLEDQVGLIAISNFDARSAQDSINAIEELRSMGAHALIFDVRFNPGGFADELVKLLDYLLPEGDLFRAVDYTGRESLDRSDAKFLDMPIAVLCNGESISAAEFFAAAIQEYNAGPVVGTPTIGKGYFQLLYPLLDGSAVGLSVGKYFTPNGNSLIGTGIQPDVLVELDEDAYNAVRSGTLDPMEDPQVLAAMELLK